MIRLLRKKIVRTRDEHSVSRRDIDREALKVLYRLNRNGNTAYLVGGGVRDLLLGRQPKDFDISTDAHPNAIKKLFRNSFLVGRRFRLAHIRFGTKVIETSTFRRRPAPSGDGLYQRRDNTFGTPEEDAKRRDFTINGLFYDIETFHVIDYVGGLSDLKKGIVRSIGDPNVRFQEDPVRMLRAVRFASRLGFRIERKTYNAIVRHRAEIAKAPPPRLLEEIYRLFGYQSGAAAMRLLKETGLLKILLPEIDAHVAGLRGAGKETFWRFVAELDRAHPAAPPVPALIFATLLCPRIPEEAERLQADGRRPVYHDIARDLLATITARLPLPRREVARATRILDAQRRFDAATRGRFSRKRFVLQETFEDAFLLYRISVAATGSDPKWVQWWTEQADRVRDEAGVVAGDQEDDAGKPRRRRSPRRRPRRRPRGRRRGGGEGR
jgi:poly(A) polymerase